MPPTEPKNKNYTPIEYLEKAEHNLTMALIQLHGTSTGKQIEEVLTNLGNITDRYNNQKDMSIFPTHTRQVDIPNPEDTHNK